MILFKLLSFSDRTKVIKRWLEDPAREAREYVRDVIMGYIVGISLIALVVLGGLALLGFGNVLGGPHQAAEVLFYVACVFLVFISIALWTLWRKIHAYTKRLEDVYRRSTARDVQYEDARDTIYIQNGETEENN